ncbi:MAG: vWA domain-containing protein [Myxococcota bacterium]
MQWTAWSVETPRGDHREAHVLVTGEASADEARAPVMVNLVLDRSGSMKGAPLSAAVEAAQQLVELSQPEDFLGLVLFDGLAEQRVPLTMMDARGKRQMVEALQGIQTGKGTALHGALELALKGIKRTLVPGRKPQLLLLTDGEPSVGPDTQDAFDELGERLAREKISVHALGLAKHYVAEVLEALTRPSGNAFEHVDGPEGLGEAMGGLMAHLYGQVSSEASIRVQPSGFVALTCRHSFPTNLDAEALTVTLGDVSRGYARRVLFSGTVSTPDWSVQLHASAKERSDVRHWKVDVERVTAESARGKLIVGISHELELVSEETAAWLSLARKDLERAEQQLEAAESHLRSVVSLSPEGIPVRRHLERLGDLRLAVERGEGDIPLLIRRAQSARAGTHVSQVIPLQNYRQRR